MDDSAISVLRVSRDDAPLRELVALLDADLNSRYGIVQAQYVQFNSLATVDAAVVAYLRGQPIGCGCYRRMDESTTEIKRMCVRPENRGRGAAARLLAELENWAIEAGFTQAILETGIKNPEAIRFYTKSGYSRTENYGQYVGMENSVCMAKSLSTA